ncbi:MAG TPA: metal-dependent hydrolase [Chloroflexi bacterium]|nr:metal-dependent hydrolase [Chloroflexota bacterium]
MLAAHLVPGYFAASRSQSHWRPEWSKAQRRWLWTTALASTVAPDLDVIYNALFRGFFNHSTLWTHSVFVYLGFGLLWFALHALNSQPYLRTWAGLVAAGGFSHLLLDVVAHGTPLLYPVSMWIFSLAPRRVVIGGVWAYLTDPVFLIEPLLFGIAIVHWAYQRKLNVRHRKWILIGITSGVVLFAVVFILTLPHLQQAVTPSTTF